MKRHAAAQLGGALLAGALAVSGTAWAAAPAGAKVVVPTPGAPVLPRVTTAFDPVSLLPAGGLLAGQRNEDTAAALARGLEGERLALAKQLQADLFVALLRANYAGTTPAVERRPGAGELAAPFLRRDQLPAAADAHTIVDVRILAYGFHAAGPTVPFVPVLDVEVRRTDPKTQRIRGTRRYVWRSIEGLSGTSSAELVKPSAPPITFASRAALERESATAADALKAASRDVAAAIVADL